ncbi:MAG: hypothetical protein LBI45_07330 [Bacteroidales bacterium]|jgi:hypothetical protein|nr:hypothetical protein [Bacteroidales bacterium]
MIEKYKQIIIPKVKTGSIANNRKSVAKYYTNNLQGKTIVNDHLGISIKFTALGKAELAYGRALHIKKTAVLEVLPSLLKVAKYNNFGIRKENDPKELLGYLNFKAFVYINDKKECVRISVRLLKTGDTYYNHEVNIIKIG